MLFGSVMVRRSPAELAEGVRKEKMLESFGYRYHCELMMYRNRAAKRVFSIEFFNDHSFEEIHRLVNAPYAKEWVFHFNEPPSEGVIPALIEDLEK